MPVKNIPSAFVKLLTGKNTKLATERLAICSDCPDRVGILCGVCGCYLKAKTREEDEKCPLDRWIKLK